MKYLCSSTIGVKSKELTQQTHDAPEAGPEDCHAHDHCGARLRQLQRGEDDLHPAGGGADDHIALGEGDHQPLRGCAGGSVPGARDLATMVITWPSHTSDRIYVSLSFWQLRGLSSLRRHIKNTK